MQRNTVLTQPITSSFLSCEKDTETILRKLFIECRPYSEELKKLLIIQAPDCLDKNYDISEYSLAKMIEEGYIILSPRVELPEHDTIKTFMVISFDNFTANATNPAFRDCMIHIDIICHHDSWYLGNYRQRPFKVIGYIDGILNKARLSGIGQLEFVGCVQEIINEDWSLHSMTYMAIHGNDDKIPPKVNE